GRGLLGDAHTGQPAHLVAFIGGKKVRLIAADGPTSAVAKIIGAVDRRAPRTVEPVTGVEGIILDKLEESAVELVAAALGDEQQLRAGVSSIFGAEIICNELEFPDLFEIQKRSLLPADTGIGNIGGGYVIDCYIVSAPAAAVGAVAALAEEGIVGRDRCDSGGDEDQLQGIPAHRQDLERRSFDRELNL